MAGEETYYPFPDLERATADRAAALQGLGLLKGDRFGMIIVEPDEFVITFLAALRIGALPVPLYPPMSFGNLDSYAERTKVVLETSGSKVLVASSSLQNILWGLVSKVKTLQKLVRVEDLAGEGREPEYPEIFPNDLAFLQYTSGSTSAPKGVMVTHENLLANAEAIATGAGCTAETSVGVSWLPLYHDMGLIGFVLTPLHIRMSVVFIPTLRFIRRPTVWFDAIHRHRGTISFAPNFAYALVTRKAREKHLEEWDLSSMKTFGCGAEPIQAQTVRDFLGLFEDRCSMQKTAFLPAYGMAEHTLCIAFKPEKDVWTTRSVSADRFQDDGIASIADGDETILEHVSCGPAFPGHEIAIFDERGTRLVDGQEGEICLNGPSVCPGYYENPTATSLLFRNGFMRTGDLGYLQDGEVYVTGRLKDLIILNGRNIHPQAIEWIVAEVEGVRKGNVVAFSRPGKTSEELVVALERKTANSDELVAAVRRRVQDELGVTINELVCLEPGNLPKTSSGKLQRRRTRELYLKGELGSQGSRNAGAAGNSFTIARHVVRSVWTRARVSILSRTL